MTLKLNFIYIINCSKNKNENNYINETAQKKIRKNESMHNYNIQY